MLEDDNMCPNCGKGDNFFWFSSTKNYELGCLYCGWKGKVRDLITEGEFKNRNRTKWIDDILNNKNDNISKLKCKKILYV